MTERPSDTEIVDSTATLLGTATQWCSAADFLDYIASLVGAVRPHPGDLPPDAYAAEFAKSTGGPIVEAGTGGKPRNDRSPLCTMSL